MPRNGQGQTFSTVNDKELASLLHKRQPTTAGIENRDVFFSISKDLPSAASSPILPSSSIMDHGEDGEEPPHLYKIRPKSELPHSEHGCAEDAISIMNGEDPYGPLDSASSSQAGPGGGLPDLSPEQLLLHG